jgi:hypothetical protein
MLLERDMQMENQLPLGSICALIVLWGLLLGVAFLSGVWQGTWLNLIGAVLLFTGINLISLLLYDLAFLTPTFRDLLYGTLGSVCMLGGARLIKVRSPPAKPS